MQEDSVETGLDVASGAVVKAEENWHGLRKFGSGSFTSLDLTQLADRKLFVAAQQGEQLPVDEVLNTEIAVRHILFHPVKSEDATTGEIDLWTRLVIILSDGRMISCGSLGLMKSLQLATIMFGPPPWPGLRGKVKQQQLKGEKRWYIIDWDLEQTPCQPEIVMIRKIGKQPANQGASPK